MPVSDRNDDSIGRAIFGGLTPHDFEDDGKEPMSNVQVGAHSFKPLRWWDALRSGGRCRGGS